jgi:hypothetical protein
MAHTTEKPSSPPALVAPEHDGDLDGLLALLATIAVQRARRLTGRDGAVVESDHDPEAQLVHSQKRAA